MTQQQVEQGKQAAATAALTYIESGMVIGVGSGSTVQHFITALQKVKHKIEGVVASSLATAHQLMQLGFSPLDPNAVPEISLYVDGADAVDSSKQLLKGKGGALTAEKILATIAKKFVCIVDESKVEPGSLATSHCPIIIEVIPMARSYVARELVGLGGDPVYRQGFKTDHSNVLLETYHLAYQELALLEDRLNTFVGVVENGIFARRRADVVLIGSEQNVICR